MGDLLTHYVSARVTGVRIRDRATAMVFTLGVFLPDLLGKPLGHFQGLPDLVEVPTHSPLGLLLACGAACFLFAPAFRRRAFVALYAGSLLHVFLDLFKSYLGRGAVMLLHPFSLKGFELGFYRTEDVFYLLPANLGILALLWLAGLRRAKPPGSAGDMSKP
ncbi:MAG TPA: metal-dependent hydrolase [Planctomycetota bacterium]|nr:metal-dependent hydrolase [Planctomycetota bacterium]